MTRELGGTRFEIHLPASPTPNVALVFVLHGRMGSRAKVRNICMALVSRPSPPSCSVVAVSFDAPNHGDVVLNAERNLTLVEGNPTHPLDMYSQMCAAAQVVSLGLDLLPALLNVNVACSCVAGVSQGGHAALLCFTHEPRLGCCVAWIGTGNYHELMLGRVTNRDAQYPAFLERVVVARDPASNQDKLANRHLCLINGSHDDLVSAALNHELVNALQPKYATPARLAFHLHPVGHTVTPEMVEQGVQFIHAYLREACTAGAL